MEGVFQDRDFSVSVLVNNPEELTISVGQTKLSFVKYPFPLVHKLVEYQGIKMLSVKECAATKAYTIGRRGEFRDYVDMYYILAENYTDLNEIIDISQKKYGKDFNARLFLEQLIYLEDIEENDLIFLKEKIDKNTIQNYLKDQVGEYDL